MRNVSVVLALLVLGVADATPIKDTQHVLQASLVKENAVHELGSRKLHGRFLHITGKYIPLVT
jgi:hypothetical protein